ncbi:MAG TPA: hypothetical protein V6D16_18155, partial [Candidatus Obscuribacterales bacterium]
MASIARKNLFEDIPRFLVAQAGIMFAVSLVTIQTGILRGFTRSTTLLIDQSQADLWVASKDMVQIELTLPLAVDQLRVAQQVPGVGRAEALIFRPVLWRNSQDEIAPVRVIGFDPQGQLFAPQNITQGSLSALKQPFSVMVDETNAGSLNLKTLNAQGAIGPLPARLVGLTRGTQSMVSSSFLFTSLENANAYVNSPVSSTLQCRSQTGSEEVQCTNTYETAPADSGPLNPSPAVPRRLNLGDPITYILIRAQPN